MEKVTYKDLSPFLRKCAIGGFTTFIMIIAYLIIFGIGFMFGIIGY